MKTKIIVPAIAAALIVAATVAAQGPSKHSETDHGHKHGEAKAAQERQGMMSPEMRERCQAMMKKREQMHSKMQTMDKELQTLISEMKERRGDEKVEVIATVVERLVQQRQAMHKMMPKMQKENMRHMMEHMKAGKETMMQCPMMKSMGMMEGNEGEEKGKPDGSHSKHHRNR